MVRTVTHATRASTQNPTHRVHGLCVALTFVLSVLVTDANAYIDPGTGSYILQLLIAGLLGAAYAVKLSWTRIRALFRSLFSRSKQDHA